MNMPATPAMPATLVASSPLYPRAITVAGFEVNPLTIPRLAFLDAIGSPFVSARVADGRLSVADWMLAFYALTAAPGKLFGVDAFTEASKLFADLPAREFGALAEAVAARIKEMSDAAEGNCIGGAVDDNLLELDPSWRSNALRRVALEN